MVLLLFFSPMSLSRALLTSLSALFAFTLASCSHLPLKTAPTELFFNPAQENSAEALKAPYVILVSIDGYRFDYTKKFSPPHLTALAQEGVAARSLRPVYPSKTFPNHYSLITGLYAEDHGIVSNDFYDPTRKESYSIPNRKAVEDGTWYGGLPLWAAAGKQNMLSASFFWVGSEADIQGMHPNYYYRYDAKVSYDARVNQVLEWLKLPEKKRPHFLTLYFEGVDTAGHMFGTKSPELKNAVMEVDQALGHLQEGIKALGLPVDVIVVSDHGMLNVQPDKAIVLDQDPKVTALLSSFLIYGKGPQMILYLKEGEPPSKVHALKHLLGKHPQASLFYVHSRKNMGPLHYAKSERAGDLVIEPLPPYVIGVKDNMPYLRGGNHGWNAQRTLKMHGIFYAVGPQFKTKAALPTFNNVDVYPLILKTLGLKTLQPVDGTDALAKAALK
jgi:hypothetical protein